MSTAILGGTFDPIHRGHVEIARAAADRFGLERVLFIPAGHPPHKRDPTDAGYEHRFRMVALACRADPRFEPSRIEAPRDDSQPHYSVETIQRLKKQLAPGERLLFIIGSDAFAEIGLWYHWQDVVRAVEFIAVSRPGTESAVKETPPGAKVHRLCSVEIPISSTEIRERLRSGESADEWLPPEVAEYIENHRLYRGA